MSLDKGFFEQMPIAEVHHHMDAGISVDDIWEISQGHGIELPFLREQSLDVLREFYQLPPDVRFSNEAGFRHFLDMFKIVLALMQTRDGLREVARRHVHTLARQKYVYEETRFAPQYSREGGLSLEEVIKSVLEGLRIGYEETRTLVKLIISIGRECEPDESVAIARAALNTQDHDAHMQPSVVGLDLACSEIEHPPEKHIAAYRLAMGTRLKMTAHAGEFPLDDGQRIKNIETALYTLGVHGLGHAVPLARSDGLLSFVANKGVRVELCPLSNRITGAIERTDDEGRDLRSLALDALLARGISVSLNTDDPLIFSTPLAEVYERTCAAYGFGESEVRQLMGNAVRGAFCTQAEKAAILDEFRRRGLDLGEMDGESW